MKRKLQNLIDRVRTATNWASVARAAASGLLLTSVIGGIAYASYASYHIGRDHGTREGQCQMGCAFLEMQYSFYDEGGDCWCQAGPNAYYAVPVRRNF